MGSIFQNPTIPQAPPTSIRQAKYFNARKNPDRGPNKQHEAQLQKAVCRYIRLKYPDVIFRSDTASGKWEYNKQRLHEKVALHSDKSFPDIFVFEPRTINGKHYCGLGLELKKDGTSVIMKIGPRKGKLSTDPHIQEQAAMLKRLMAKGYYCNFAVGIDEATKIIDWYMGRENATMF